MNPGGAGRFEPGRRAIGTALVAGALLVVSAVMALIAVTLDRIEREAIGRQ